MKIKLLDYAGHAKWVEIPDNTEEIRGRILSGDMILEHPVYEDASDDRHTDFYDGSWAVKKENFDKFNELTDSYNVFDLSVDDDE